MCGSRSVVRYSSGTVSRSPLSSVGFRCCSCSTSEVNEPVAAFLFRFFGVSGQGTSVKLVTVTLTASGESAQNKSLK